MANIAQPGFLDFTSLGIAAAHVTAGMYSQQPVSSGVTGLLPQPALSDPVSGDAGTRAYGFVA